MGITATLDLSWRQRRLACLDQKSVAIRGYAGIIGVFRSYAPSHTDAVMLSNAAVCNGHPHAVKQGGRAAFNYSNRTARGQKKLETTLLTLDTTPPVLDTTPPVGV